MLFGRAQEEIAALEAAARPLRSRPRHHRCARRRGRLGTSLTQRGSVRSFAFVTPRVGEGEPPSRWLDGIRGADAGAIYMGAHEAPAIAAALVAAGRTPATPVAIVENASLPESRVHYTTLAGLPAFAEHPFGGPTLLLIGPQFRARARQSAERDAVMQATAANG